MVEYLDARGRQKGGGRLTPFGEKAREIRKAKKLLLIDMAHVAGVSPGFLSLVETGKKQIPDRLIPSLVSGLDLNKDEEKDLLESAALSAREYKIQLEDNAGPMDRRIAHALQTGFAKMSPADKAKILDLLEKD